MKEEKLSIFVYHIIEKLAKTGNKETQGMKKKVLLTMK